MIFRQTFDHESSTFTYFLADPKTKEAVVIDPVLTQSERDFKIIEDLELKLLYILETHLHADHITGASALRKKTGAKVGLSSAAKVSCADLMLKDGDEINFGSYQLKAIATPGHTNTCMTYFTKGFVFTGDCLLIRGCGRTDFQEGSSDKLFESVRTKIFSLPDETLVYPAHDYKGLACSSIAEEKKFNPRLNLSNSLETFKKIMTELKLSPPKQIDKALPANLNCGQILQ